MVWGPILSYESCEPWVEQVHIYLVELQLLAGCPPVDAAGSDWVRAVGEASVAAGCPRLRNAGQLQRWIGRLSQRVCFHGRAVPVAMHTCVRHADAGGIAWAE
jgi:hypothetical protein